MTYLLNISILRAARESIPRGARRDYKSYWLEEVQNVEEKVSQAREILETELSIDSYIALKAASAKYRRAVKKAARQR